MAMKIAPGVVEEKIEHLLEEGEQRARERERMAFDRAAGPRAGRIVIYGAGGLGQRTLAGLRANGSEPLAFADRNPGAWGQILDGVRVFSPDDAIRKFGSDAVFVVAVWNPGVPGGISQISAELIERGCRLVVPFVLLFWKYPDTFLPYYLWDLPSRLYGASSRIREAFALFEGEHSQAEFVRNLELRLTGNFDCLKGPAKEPQYFPQSLISPLPDECFIDCGAYDGDT